MSPHDLPLLIDYSLWLTDFEVSNPELSKQIHLFSSFFYKNLSSEAKYVISFTIMWLPSLLLSPKKCYEKVKKWTKDDIVQKRYIIVPINEKYVLSLIWGVQQLIYTVTIGILLSSTNLNTTWPSLRKHIFLLSTPWAASMIMQSRGLPVIWRWKQCSNSASNLQGS